MLKLITDTIKDAKNEVAHYLEVFIDMTTDNEVLDNVPLVSEAVKILNIKDAYHINKIKRNYAAFIKSVIQMNEHESNNFLNKFMQDNKIAESVAETIFDIIIYAQKPIKAEVLGNLSKSLARNEITLEEYDTLSLMIYASSIASLQALPKFLKENDNKSYASQSSGIKNEALLFSLGIATRHGNMFRIDERGIKLAKYGFELEVAT